MDKSFKNLQFKFAHTFIPIQKPIKHNKKLSNTHEAKT